MTFRGFTFMFFLYYLFPLAVHILPSLVYRIFNDEALILIIFTPSFKSMFTKVWSPSFLKVTPLRSGIPSENLK